MTDISRHSLLKQAYDVCQEIEKCGASPQLTNAVTKSSELLRALDAFIPVAGAAPATNMVGATAGALAEIDLNAADFSDAVMWLKEGRRVARAGWRNDKYLVMSTCQWSTHAGSYEQQRIQFRATNSGGDWSASSDDMLATDWLALN